MKISVNAAIELVAALKTRAQDLKELRDRNTSDREETYSNAITKKTALFDPSVVDGRVMDINNAIRTISCAIKASNVVTLIDVDVDEKALMSAVPKREGV